MSNIKLLPGAPIPGLEPVPEVVEVLEEFLEAAKNGSLRSIALAGIRANGDAFTTWEDGGKKGTFQIMGAMDWLKDRMFTALREKE